MRDFAPQQKSGLGSNLIVRDQRELLGNISLAVGGQAAAYAAGFLCMILTVRLLKPEGYGRLALFFMCLEVLSQFAGWPNPGLIRYGRQELGETGRLSKTFWARFALFLISVAVISGLLFGFSSRLDRYLRLEYPAYLMLLIYLVINEGIFLAQAVFQTTSRFTAYAATAFGIRALNFLFIFTAFVMLRWNANAAGILGAQIISLAVIAALSLALIPRNLLTPVCFSRNAVRQVSSYSWPLILGGLSALVVNWVDLIVIKQYCSPEAVGWYAVAYQAVTVLTALQVACVGAVLPLLVSLTIEKRRDTILWYLDEALPQIAWGIGLVCTLLAAAAEALPFVMGRAYQPAVLPCQVLMAGVGFSAMAAFLAAQVKALDKVRAVFIVMALMAVLNVALDLWLVPKIGITGAAVSTATAFIMSSLLYFPILYSTPELRGATSARQYVILAGLASPAAFGILAMVWKEPPARLCAAIGLMALWAILARALSVFRLTTLERVQTVRMPQWTVKLLRRFYDLMAR